MANEMIDNGDNLKPLRLLVNPAEAIEMLTKQMERGRDIRTRRIRSRQELDSARSEKNAWNRSLTETFRALFSYATPAEQHLNWSPPILPEYAGLELFVEQFYEEMDQRLQRLKQIGKMVQAMPGPAPLQPPAGPAVAVQTSATAPAQATAPRTSQPPAPAARPNGKMTTPTPQPERILLLDIAGQSPEANAAIADFLEKLGIGVLRVGGQQPFDLDAGGAWQLQLARVLKTSGITVDLNRLL
jgi:hypothetical protein